MTSGLSFEGLIGVGLASAKVGQDVLVKLLCRELKVSSPDCRGVVVPSSEARTIQYTT